jgi:hypothetical protein
LEDEAVEAAPRSRSRRETVSVEILAYGRNDPISTKQQIGDVVAEDKETWKSAA